MTLAGKYGAGVLSIGATATAGLQALPRQWSFAEESALKHNNTVDRKNWRILMSWHIAETREKAREQAGDGLMRHNNEYTVKTLRGGEGSIFKTADEAVDETAFSEQSVAVIGTPDDLVAKIREMVAITGGFGCVIGFAHDWANREDTRRSWDMVARYVIPEVNGLLDDYRESHKFVTEDRAYWERHNEAVMNKIQENKRASEVLEAEGWEGEKSPDNHDDTMKSTSN